MEEMGKSLNLLNRGADGVFHWWNLTAFLEIFSGLNVSVHNLNFF